MEIEGTQFISIPRSTPPHMLHDIDKMNALTTDATFDIPTVPSWVNLHPQLLRSNSISNHSISPTGSKGNIGKSLDINTPNTCLQEIEDHSLLDTPSVHIMARAQHSHIGLFQPQKRHSPKGGNTYFFTDPTHIVSITRLVIRSPQQHRISLPTTPHTTPPRSSAPTRNRHSPCVETCIYIWNARNRVEVKKVFCVCFICKLRNSRLS